MSYKAVEMLGRQLAASMFFMSMLQIIGGNFGRMSNSQSYVYSCVATVWAARTVARWLNASQPFCFVHTDLPSDLSHKFSVGGVPGGPSTD